MMVMLLIIVMAALQRRFRGMMLVMMVVVMAALQGGVGALARRGAGFVVHQERIGDGAIMMENRLFDLRAQPFDFFSKIARGAEFGFGFSFSEFRRLPQLQRFDDKNTGGNKEHARQSARGERDAGRPQH